MTRVHILAARHVGGAADERFDNLGARRVLVDVNLKSLLPKVPQLTSQIDMEVLRKPGQSRHAQMVRACGLPGTRAM
jgi:3-deoxy-D-manno-octulosonic-acid transferase